MKVTLGAAVESDKCFNRPTCKVPAEDRVPRFPDERICYEGLATAEVVGAPSPPPFSFEVCIDPDPTPFPNYYEKWDDHRLQYDPAYESPEVYREDAQDIVDGGYSGPVERCLRYQGHAPADTVYWVPNPGKRRTLRQYEGSIIFVNGAGDITNYYPPDRGRAYWEEQCKRKPIIG